MDEIVKIRLQNELDIVMAYKRAMQLSEYTGMNISSQTKFATAVSEICRNVLEYVGEGSIRLGIVEEKHWFLQAVVADRGRGIANVEEVLRGKFSNGKNKGNGISNSKKLVDEINIETKMDAGTRVTLRKKIPRFHPPFNKSIIEAWQDHFDKEKNISPYEEIKKQNIQLIEVMDTLRVKNIEAEDQLAEIKRLNSELDKFAYTVSHDLKAPLKNIEGIISIIEESLEIPDLQEAKNSCEILKSQTLRMDRLIHEILSYARGGKTSIVKTRVAISGLVNDVVQTLKVPKRFSIEINPDLPVLFTEEVLLSQIFANLISNAIKYHDRDGGFISIDFYKENEHFVFYVEDDGPGISSDNAKKIFKIFESLTKESSGIGLSIVSNIVNDKGGRVWVESNGRGSKFLFTWSDKEIGKEHQTDPLVK